MHIAQLTRKRTYGVCERSIKEPKKLHTFLKILFWIVYVYIFQPGCQLSSCNGDGSYYGQSCGLRPSYNYKSPCGSTGGWPYSYCGNDWNYMTYCDTNLCSNDCQSVGQDGGFCDSQQNKCYCFKQNRPLVAASTTEAYNLA